MYSFKSTVYYQYMFLVFPLVILEKNHHSILGDIWHISYGTLSFSLLDYIEYTHGARKMCAEVILVHIYKLDMSFSNLSKFKKLRVVAFTKYCY
jgi:hypothetical protein